MNNRWIVFFFVLVVIVLLFSDGYNERIPTTLSPTLVGLGITETYEPAPRELVNDQFDHLASRNIRITKGSLRDIRLTQSRIEKPQKKNVFQSIINLQEAYTVKASTQPVFVLKSSVLLGKKVTIRETGESAQQSIEKARSGLEDVRRALLREASFRGLS